MGQHLLHTDVQKGLRTVIHSLALFLVVLISLALALAAPAHASGSIENVRVWPAEDKTRVVFDLSDEAKYSYFTLFEGRPYRIVIDFEGARSTLDYDAVGFQSDVLNVIRPSTPKDDRSSRIVLEINAPAAPNIFPLGPGGGSGHRLVVDIPGSTNIAEPRVTRQAGELPARPVIVAIDAGHGGRDPGSIGPAGTHEKVVTLAVARRLADRINQDPAMRAVLTRTGDHSVSLNQRASMARRERADFFLSLHADAFHSPQPRGASVWVLSDRRAETEYGRALENKERLSEELIDVEDALQNGESEYLARAFLDMYRNNTMVEGQEAGKIILKNLEGTTTLHRRSPQGASLAVLNSMRMPSVLVELGFISNPQKERLLINANHQQRLAEALYRGLREYFIQHPIDGTILASQELQTHVVRSGESLSVIAQRYGTSVRAIREHNNLRNDTIRVGQTLEIPLQ